MKIGYVIHRFPWPSETFISREVEDLIALGHDISIYAFEGPEGRDLELLTPEARALMARTQYISRGEAAQALLSPLSLKLLGPNARFSREATVKTHAAQRLGRAVAVWCRAKKDGVQGLHAHWPYATQICDLIGAGTGTPYSVSIHAHEVAHDNGHFPAAFERLEFATFCNGAAMNHLLDQLSDDARDKAHLIYHGVNTTNFTKLAPPEPGKTLRVLSGGRLTPTKGFDRLVRGCAAALAEGIDVELTILGRGSIADDLQKLAEELGFGGRLHLPGWVRHDEVRNYLQQSHVFALLAATNFNDGLPNVVLEAMACGRPVIISPLPAAREAVTDGETGFVLNGVDDYDGFVAALRHLSEGEEAKRMGEAAHETIRDLYDARKHIAALADLFERTYG